MTAKHLLVCVRYIENNPVRAKLARSAEQWSWSGALAHIRGRNDALVKVAPLRSIIGGDWRKFLSGVVSGEQIEDLREHERTGRPLGCTPGTSFVEQVERKLGRKLAPQKPGRKPKNKKK